jgi:hypothetical protein
MTDRVLLAVGNRLLCLSRTVFEAALRDGAALVREADLDVAIAVPASDSDHTQLLTAEDAAAQLSVDASWLLRQAREGRIDHVRIGKYVRFQPPVIIEQCARRATAADMTVSAIDCAGHKHI